MFIRINLIILLLFTYGFSFLFWKKDPPKPEIVVEQPVVEEKVKETVPEPVPEKKPEEPKPQEPDIFQSAVIIKNQSYHTWTGDRPWNKQNSANGYGTGFILSGNMILTNAHVVLDAEYISVKHYHDRNFFKARVKFTGYDCDLAILEVEDPAFTLTSPVVSITDKKPVPGSEVMILGYPEGSENLSVERGTITNLEKLRYAFTGTDYRNVIRVKTSIRPGFSGGPAIESGKLTGLAFQINRKEKDTAYLVPATVINHFLKDIEDGRYDGFPETGFMYQSGENNWLRKSLKIPDDTSGILVNRVFPGTTFYGALKEGDFLYKIDANTISSEGHLRENPESTIEDLLAGKFIGDEVTVRFFRDGKDYYITQRLKKSDIFNLFKYDSVNYMIESGLVFQPLSRTLLNREDDVNSSIAYHYWYFLADNLFKFASSEIVLSGIFPDPENISATQYQNNILETINGYTPDNLEHLGKLWKKLEKETIVLKFRGAGLPLVLDPSIREQINVRVRKRYAIENK